MGLDLHEAWCKYRWPRARHLACLPVVGSIQLDVKYENRHLI